MQLTLRATGTVPADEVWERYADPSRWSEWGPYVTGATLTTPRLAAGARGVVRGPLGVSAAVVILAVDEIARTWAWRARCGPLVLVLEHGVEDLGVEERGRGTRTWLTLRGAAPLVLAYSLPARVALRALVRGRAPRARPPARR